MDLFGSFNLKQRYQTSYSNLLKPSLNFLPISKVSGGGTMADQKQSSMDVIFPHGDNSNLSSSDVSSVFPAVTEETDILTSKLNPEAKEFIPSLGYNNNSPVKNNQIIFEKSYFPSNCIDTYGSNLIDSANLCKILNTKNLSIDRTYSVRPSLSLNKIVQSKNNIEKVSKSVSSGSVNTNRQISPFSNLIIKKFSVEMYCASDPDSINVVTENSKLDTRIPTAVHVAKDCNTCSVPASIPSTRNCVKVTDTTDKQSPLQSPLKNINSVKVCKSNGTIGDSSTKECELSAEETDDSDNSDDEETDCCNSSDDDIDDYFCFDRGSFIVFESDEVDNVCSSERDPSKSQTDESEDENDYGCDIFNVDLNDGWFDGGLQISALITSIPVNYIGCSLPVEVSGKEDNERPEIIEANAKWIAEINNNCARLTPKKVQFSSSVDSIEVDHWDRKGEWEMLARDSMRFKRKIANEFEPLLIPVLSSAHRERVFKQLYGTSQEFDMG